MPHKQKLSVEEKIKWIRVYLNGDTSLGEIARQCGVNPKTFRTWVYNYKNEGSAAFLPRRNRVYSPELKIRAVTDYLSGVGSLLDICDKYHIFSDITLRDWIKLYNIHGDFNSVKHSGGGSYMKKGRMTTQEERIEIARACIKNGRNYGEVAKKYNISYQQARSWTLKYEELGNAGLEDRRGKRKKDQEPRTELEKAQIEIERLKHQLYMAEMERDLLKKLDEIERGDAYRK